MSVVCGFLAGDSNIIRRMPSGRTDVAGARAYGKEEQTRICVARVQRLWAAQLPHKRKCGAGHTEIGVKEVLQKRTQAYRTQDTKEVGNRVGPSLVWLGQ